MREYIEQHLNLNSQQATELRQHYWERYGATLLGLVRHHAINPHHFLHATHQFDDLKKAVKHEPHLKSILQKLPGRKVLFSNAPRAYALAVLDIIGIRHFFDAIYTVETLRFYPKPSMPAFRRLLAREGVNPRHCIFVEDTLANLKPAKKLGMKTVWVSTRLRGSAHVDYKLSTASQLRHVHRWL